MNNNKKAIFTFVAIFLSACTSSPVTIINNTTTIIENGYIETFPEKKVNIPIGESYTYDYPDNGFPYEHVPLSFFFHSSVSGEIEISNIHLKLNMHNYVTINTDFSVTLEYGPE